MKLSSFFYLLSFVYGLLFQNISDQVPTSSRIRVQDQVSTQAQNVFEDQLADQTQSLAHDQDYTQVLNQANPESLTSQSPEEPLIKRAEKGAFPRVSRSRNLSDLCISPKKTIPCIMALHRTRSAGANQQSVSKKEIANLPNLGIPSSPTSASLPSPLSLGHIVTTQFDFTSK